MMVHSTDHSHRILVAFAAMRDVTEHDGVSGVFPIIGAIVLNACGRAKLFSRWGMRSSAKMEDTKV